MVTCTNTQGFGLHPETYKPLKGHSGYDRHCGYGTEIEWPIVDANSVFYKEISKKYPARDGSGYSAVCGICEREGEVFEFQIGHPSNILAKLGSTLTTGQVVALEGNHGFVFENGVQITKAMQDAGDKRGSHRHYQKRPVWRTKILEAGEMYLDAFGGKPYKDSNGFYYKVIDYKNGFNGCVDPRGELDRYDSWKNKPIDLTQIFEPNDPPIIVQQKISLVQSLIQVLQKIVSLFK